MSSDGKIAFSVVVPVYNESLTINTLHKRLSLVLNKLNGSYEIIFVDDGSTDNSYELLKQIGCVDASVCVLSFSRNFGQHKAAIAGLLEAAGEYVITIDADLQNPPEEIPKLVAKIREGYDMVAGIRKDRKDPFFRRLGSFFINLIIYVQTGLKMRDYGSMLRIFQNKTAKELADAFSRTEGYITMLVAKVTHDVAEVVVEHDERSFGKSKYNLRKLVKLIAKIVFCYHEGFFRFCGGRVQKPLFVISKRIKYGKETFLTSQY